MRNKLKFYKKILNYSKYIKYKTLTKFKIQGRTVGFPPKNATLLRLSEKYQDSKLSLTRSNVSTNHKKVPNEVIQSRKSQILLTGNKNS